MKYQSDLFEVDEFDNSQNEIEHANNWTSDSFSALFSIIKEIRDNLFHGRKIDIDLLQDERSKVLVQIGANLTDVLLAHLIEAEENYNQK